jgi:hypothetical protein
MYMLMKSLRIKVKKKIMSQLDELDRGIRIDAVRHQCGANKLMICFTYKK